MVSERDREVLRTLGHELAEVSALPVHAEKAAMWTRVNDLKAVRPMVWINEIPWHEMNVDDELTLRCEGDAARGAERLLRTTLYQWRHMPGDMVVSPYLACAAVVRDSGFGIDEDVEIVKTDDASSVVSRHFHRQIVEPEDIEKIRMPEVVHDAAASERVHDALSGVFAGILPVRKTGVKGSWFAPWDFLIRLWGVEEAMMDLVMRPDMVNAAMTRLVDAYLCRLDQWEAQNLLSLNNDNTRIGSGAYGYTTELPGAGFDPARVTPKDMWGCATAQIFSDVSPEMHWEFALKHEMRWLTRWGMSYYGCCEPLDLKLELLRRIPNLRKISMSPWVDPERAAKAVGGDFVYSCKPNPAILAEDTWRPGQAREELRRVLDATRGLNVEIIMKDISTVRYQPQRLWEWARMATELAEAYAA